MSELLKLVGGIETLQYFFSLEIAKIPVNQVKKLYREILENKTNIEPISFKKGVSWFYKLEKISVHQLDAFLIY